MKDDQYFATGHQLFLLEISHIFNKICPTYKNKKIFFHILFTKTTINDIMLKKHRRNENWESLNGLNQEQE